MGCGGPVNINIYFIYLLCSIKYLKKKQTTYMLYLVMRYGGHVNIDKGEIQQLKLKFQYLLSYIILNILNMSGFHL